MQSTPTSWGAALTSVFSSCSQQSVTSSYLGHAISCVSKILHLGATCSEIEFANAMEIKRIHDLIEEVAYRAFVEKVKDLNIEHDCLTEEQSGRILSHIKAQAHREMYKKEGGYITERAKLLDPSQVQRVIQNGGRIVHDRDTKLTDARYYSLSELLLALDDHNTMVKEILLQSWYKCHNFSDRNHEHLEEIKERVNFYGTLSEQLKFNLQGALRDRKAFWDKYFPGKREANREISEQFVNIQEVRHYMEHKVNTLKGFDLDEQLIRYLNEEEIIAYFEPRQIRNRVRCQEVQTVPLLADRHITVRQFLSYYFPEEMEDLEK
jgi:hypothetical protein